MNGHKDRLYWAEALRTGHRPEPLNFSAQSINLLRACSRIALSNSLAGRSLARCDEAPALRVAYAIRRSDDTASMQL